MDVRMSIVEAARVWPAYDAEPEKLCANSARCSKHSPRALNVYTGHGDQPAPAIAGRHAAARRQPGADTGDLDSWLTFGRIIHDVRGPHNGWQAVDLDILPAAV